MKNFALITNWPEFRETVSVQYYDTKEDMEQDLEDFPHLKERMVGKYQKSD